MLFKGPRNRTTRLLLLILVIVVCWAGLVVYRHKTRLHIIQPDLFQLNTSSSSPHLLLPDSTTKLCAAHGFPPFIQTLPQRRKVYDLFLLSTELDWLEIRLHTLSPYVDYFIIVESLTTFTGLPKPAHLAENWSRFAPFHHKIIHRIVPDPLTSTRTWDHEDYLRNSLFLSVFHNLTGPASPHPGDVLMISDIDEIPKPTTTLLLRACRTPDYLTLRSNFYYYSFQYLHQGPQWAHPQSTTFSSLTTTPLPKDLRNGEGPLLTALRRWWHTTDLWDASWHCSSCFATVGEMVMKMESFSHVGWNTAENRDVQTVVERVRQGLDLFGREGEVYVRVEGNRDVPDYVLERGGEFGYMLNRDGPEAGFRDVGGEG